MKKYRPSGIYFSEPGKLAQSQKRGLLRKLVDTQKEGKPAFFDKASRPGKPNARPKVANNPKLEATASKRWNRLKNASIDETYPVDPSKRKRG